MGRVQLNAAACIRSAGRISTRDPAVRLRTATFASASSETSSTVTVSISENSTRPAPDASSAAVCSAARISEAARACTMPRPEVAMNWALRRSASTMRADVAGSMGR